MNWAQKNRIAARLRLYSGWVLFFYAMTHLINHSIGIFGLDAMEKARLVFIGFWRLPVMDLVIPLSVIVHFIFVLHKLFLKTTFRGMPRAEWVQIVIGLLLPGILTGHFFETRMTTELFDVNDTYSYYLFWSFPGYLFVFLLFIILVWIHGTIGIRFYIKQKKWYPRWKGWLSGIAVALPIFATWGMLAAVNEINLLQQDSTWTDELIRKNNPGNVDLHAWSDGLLPYIELSYISFLILFFTTRKIYLYVRKRRSGILVKYLEGTAVSITKGSTLLEASLKARIPHAHVCGGRGRCSTCRVQIIEGLESLPPPSDDELALLNQVKVGSAVRLACRTRPTATCTIYPLLLPNVTLQQSLWKKSNYHGTDRDVAILFTDLRGFTSMAEEKLPYDVVFLLNQYFHFMGQAVETHHGRIDKFIGDAIMAVFGTDRDKKTACRDALAAARSMRFQLDRLNAQLKNELEQPLQMGFGIHCGHVIIGEMGYKESNNLVAIGDATNTASRLESLTKDFNCELIVSKETIDCADLDFSRFEQHRVELRGRQKPMTIFSVKEVKEIEI